MLVRANWFDHTVKSFVKTFLNRMWSWTWRRVWTDCWECFLSRTSSWDLLLAGICATRTWKKTSSSPCGRLYFHCFGKLWRNHVNQCYVVRENCFLSGCLNSTNLLSACFAGWLTSRRKKLWLWWWQSIKTRCLQIWRCRPSFACRTKTNLTCLWYRSWEDSSNSHRRWTNWNQSV